MGNYCLGLLAAHITLVLIFAALCKVKGLSFSQYFSLLALHTANTSLFEKCIHGHGPEHHCFAPCLPKRFPVFIEDSAYGRLEVSFPDAPEVSQAYRSVLTTQALYTCTLVLSVSLRFSHTLLVSLASFLEAFPMRLFNSVSRDRMSEMYF